MGNSWPLKKLKDLGVTLIDCVHKTPKAVDSGVPYIGIPQMNNGVIDFDANPRLISEEDFNQWTIKAYPTYGDIILSRRCNPGETAYVPKNAKFALGQNLVLLRPNPEMIHPGYLRWALNSPLWWSEVNKYRNSGAVFDSLKCADIPNFEIPEPPYSVQKNIDNALLSMSNKIEINRQINQTLEQMAQTLFKSWFVDFDPVLDNALDTGFFEHNPDVPDELKQRALQRQEQRQLLGNHAAENTDNATGSAQPLPESIRQLFPSEFEESELGWVPKGWKVTELANILTVKRGGSPRPIKDFIVPEGLPWVKISDATSSSSRFLCETKEFIKEEGLKKTVYLKSGSLILSNSATPGIPKFLDLDACIHDGWLYFPQKERLGDKYLFQLFLEIRPALIRMGNGSVFTNLKTDILKSHQVVLAPENIISYFDKYLCGLHDKLYSIEKEILSLTKLRDTLLPKLISGDLRLDDVAAMTEEVTTMV